MILRLENSSEELVTALEKVSGPVTAWLHDRITGKGWSVTPYSDYRKVWVEDSETATALILTL